MTESHYGESRGFRTAPRHGGMMEMVPAHRIELWTY
jgi:hypothetical protein